MTVLRRENSMTDTAAPPTFKNRSRAYMKAITFIALNDESGSGHSPDEIATYITTALVSETWRLSERTVAKEIAFIHERHGIAVGRATRAATRWPGITRTSA